MNNFTGFYVVMLGLAAFTGDCPDSPNCVSSRARDQKHAVEPFHVKGDPAAAWSAIRSVIESLPRTAVVEVTDRYLHAECKSRLFGFTDDLELLLDPTSNVIEIRSASRTGYYDFGVNRRRVDDLRRTLRDKGLIR